MKTLKDQLIGKLEELVKAKDFVIGLYFDGYDQSHSEVTDAILRCGVLIKEISALKEQIEKEEKPRMVDLKEANEITARDHSKDIYGPGNDN